METTGIILYFVFVIIDIMLFYIITRCLYDYYDEDKIKLPIIIHIVLAISCFIPILNIIYGIIATVALTILWADSDIHINHWLFKKI